MVTSLMVGCRWQSSLNSSLNGLFELKLTLAKGLAAIGFAPMGFEGSNKRQCLNSCCKAALSLRAFSSQVFMEKVEGASKLYMEASQ